MTNPQMLNLQNTKRELGKFLEIDGLPINTIVRTVCDNAKTNSPRITPKIGSYYTTTLLR